MVDFAELAKLVDRFLLDHGLDPGIKSNLLDLVQHAVSYGESKEQSKIGGILASAVRMFMDRGNK